VCNLVRSRQGSRIRSAKWSETEQIVKPLWVHVDSHSNRLEHPVVQDERSGLSSLRGRQRQMTKT
jgi:hypothetical protein